jgi:predicted cobalt transporter CbtA
VNPGLTAADYVTRAMLISSMVAVPIGIALIVLRVSIAGAILVGLGLSGTIGIGIVRASLARAFATSAENSRERVSTSR